MNKGKHIINGMKYLGYIERLYEKGVTPFQAKNHIIKDLNKFYKNKYILNDLMFNSVVSDWINLLHNRESIDGFEQRVIEIIDVYNKALDMNTDETFNLISASLDESIHVGNLFWSLYDNNEESENKFDRVNQKMKFIGQITEGILKHLMKEFYGILLISKGRNAEYIKISNMGFGVIANNLLDYHGSLFLINGLRISDWRNISAHHKYVFIKDKIQCRYGKFDKEKVIEITEEELDDVKTRLNEIMHILNFSHKMFVYDNTLELYTRKSSGNGFSTSNQGRPEIGMLMDLTAISAGGFEIIDFEYDSNLAVIKLKELYMQCINEERLIDLAKILIVLWRCTKSKIIRVEYEKEQTDLLNISTTGNTCKRCAKGEFKLGTFMKKVRVEK